MTSPVTLGNDSYFFAPVYNAGAQYQLDDVVTFERDVYVYKNKDKAVGVNPTINTHWVKIFDRYGIPEAYNNATLYEIGSIVVYNGDLKICHTKVTGIAPSNSSYWGTIAVGVTYQGEYYPDTTYQQNSVVMFQQSLYINVRRCQAVLPTDRRYWVKVIQSITAGRWYKTNTNYAVGSVVAYKDKFYQVTATNPVNLPDYLDAAGQQVGWKTLYTGLSYKGDWYYLNTYYPNDFVRHNGSVYRAVLQSQNVTPDQSSASWEPIVKGVMFAGEWQEGFEYYPNTTVTRNGKVFVSKSQHSSNNFAAQAAEWEEFRLNSTNYPDLFTATGDGWISVTADTTVKAGQNIIVSGGDNVVNVTLPQFAANGDAVKIICADVGVRVVGTVAGKTRISKGEKVELVYSEVETSWISSVTSDKVSLIEMFKSAFVFNV